MNCKPLDPDLNEIRLLTLFPPDDSRLCCTIFNVSLIHAPDYVTLSYCWGKTDTIAIFVDGESVQITVNLGAALRNLQKRGYGRIWVDALCISQTDKSEKSQQLLWMGSIYQRARQVVAWTGSMSESFQTDAALDGMLASETRTDWTASTMSAIDEAIVAFFNRPYWRRVWVVQELALSKLTTIHCGDRSISWTDVARAIERLKSSTDTNEKNEDIKFSAITYLSNLMTLQKEMSPSKKLVYNENKRGISQIIDCFFDIIDWPFSCPRLLNRDYLV